MSLQEAKNNDNEQNHIKKIKKGSYLFSFCDAICYSRFIFNRRKRNFFIMSSHLIDSKLSVENFLELSNDFELLKKKLFTEEQYTEFNELPQLTYEEQIKQTL